MSDFAAGLVELAAAKVEWGPSKNSLLGTWGATDFSEIPRTFTNDTKAFNKYVRCMSMSEPLIWKAFVDAYELGKFLVVTPNYTIIVL